MPEVIKNMNVCNLRPNNSVDSYTIKHLLAAGKGGFGKVYAAIEDGQTNEIALKLFTVSEGTPDYNWRFKKFKDENKALNILKGHPHIVLVADNKVFINASYNGKKAKVIYYTMELLSGSLDEYLLNNYNTWSAASRISTIIQITDALEFAHSQNIYHRDLYLDNVLLEQLVEPLKVKLADFGAAKLLSEEPKVLYHQPVGNIKISSPEAIVGLLGGKNVNKDKFIISDIYSLGLFLYNIMTSEEPTFVRNATGYMFLEAYKEGLHKVDTTNDKRRNFLYKDCIPMLNAIKKKAIILTDKINNKAEVEAILNQLFLETTIADYEKRLNDIKDVKNNLTKCLELINEN